MQNINFLCTRIIGLLLLTILIIGCGESGKKIAEYKSDEILAKNEIEKLTNQMRVMKFDNDNMKNDLIEKSKQIEIMKVDVDKYLVETAKKMEYEKEKEKEISGIKDQRKVLEMAYPIVGFPAFVNNGKTQDQIVIDSKSLVDSTTENVASAKRNYENRLKTGQKNEGEMNLLIQTINAAQTAFNIASLNYRKAKSDEATISGNGIQKGKKEITDLEEKKAEAEAANLNPTVLNWSRTNGRLTFKGLVQKNEAIKGFDKDIKIVKLYVEALEDFDKRILPKSK